jgi:hypothetical protein
MSAGVSQEPTHSRFCAPSFAFAAQFAEPNPFEPLKKIFLAQAKAQQLAPIGPAQENPKVHFRCNAAVYLILTSTIDSGGDHISRGGRPLDVDKEQPLQEHERSKSDEDRRLDVGKVQTLLKHDRSKSDGDRLLDVSKVQTLLERDRSKSDGDRRLDVGKVQTLQEHDRSKSDGDRLLDVGKVQTLLERDRSRSDGNRRRRQSANFAGA